MSFHDDYTRLYNQAEPSPILVNRTLLAARPAARPVLRRAALLAVSFVLVLTIAASALAAASPDFNQWLYRYAPSTAMLFRPVNAVCEDQGIHVEVQAIQVENNTAEIYVTLTDTQGDLLDATVDLFDSYYLDTPGGASAGCILADWNEDTRQATFLIHYRSEHPIRQDKLTFGFSQLLTGKQKTTMQVTSLDAPLPKQAAASPGERLRGWGSSDGPSALLSKDMGMLDLPEDGTELIPGVYYLGSGWADGLLHVQLRYADIVRTDNHGFIWLEDAEGREVHSSFNLSAWAENRRDSIEDYVFTVTPDQLTDMTVMGEFITCDNHLSGSWAVTFPIAETTLR